MQAQFHPQLWLRQAIRLVRKPHQQAFCVDFILNFPCEEGVTVCVEAQVPVLSFFWGDPALY
jgi:nitronate monooxygenase